MDDHPGLTAALQYAGRGWAAFPIRPLGKQPWTRNGVRDATTDPDSLIRLFKHKPGANVAVACGAPGPTVLDIDDMSAGARAVEVARAAGAPEVATARGVQFYFAGRPAGTVAVEYGELRGTGSYVVAPPSIHPSGKQYVWVLSPSKALPTLPGGLVAADAPRAGEGLQRAFTGRIPHGQRHPYLVDFAVRLVRAGVVDPGMLRAHLQLQFALACELDPRPAPDYFAGLARDASTWRIAEREAAHAAFINQWRTPNGEES